MLDAVEEGEVDKEDFIPRKALSSSEGRLISIGGVCDFFDEAGLRVRVIFKPWRSMAESGFECEDESLIGMSRHSYIYRCAKWED